MQAQAAQEAPAALLAPVRRWKAAGGAGQPPSRWSTAQWQKWLPEHAVYIASLPQPISRDDVVLQCAAAPEGPGPATRAFIASMIWGFGSVGYGGYRTHRVLTVNEGAGETLARVARIARDEGTPSRGWRSTASGTSVWRSRRSTCSSARGTGTTVRRWCWIDSFATGSSGLRAGA